jgi:hypothetical protein
MRHNKVARVRELNRWLAPDWTGFPRLATQSMTEQRRKTLSIAAVARRDPSGLVDISARADRWDAADCELDGAQDEKEMRS